MICQLLSLIVAFYIFIATIYTIEPGKNAKYDADLDLDISGGQAYITEVTVLKESNYEERSCIRRPNRFISNS